MIDSRDLLSLTNRQGRLCGAEGSAERSACGPHGREIKIQSRAEGDWDQCARACCRSEDELRVDAPL